MNKTVAFGTTLPAYNETPPFHPDTPFAELPFTDTSPRANWPYTVMRQLFLSLGFDRERFGTPYWNPLGHLIQPGQTVALKPNFVLSFNGSGQDVFAVVTHPSILRALVDYVYIALQGAGRLVIADAPQMDCDWRALMQAQRLEAIQEFYARKFHFSIEVYDLRNFALINHRKAALTTNRQTLPGDPAGSVIINLGARSHFYGLPSANYYGADYNRQETIAHHHGDIHEYCVSKTILAADVLISVPKMKTHKKVGVTLNLKGLVGINTNKEYLVHYRLGTPKEGGDQLPEGLPGRDRMVVKVQRWVYDKLLARQSKGADAVYQVARGMYSATMKRMLHVSADTVITDGGNWHGNDSAWRMTADLAKILFFADTLGKLRATPQRRLFCVVDGIIGGDRLGPLAPDAKHCGCLIAGEHPMAVDLVTTRLMGFDPRRLRQFDVVFEAGWNFGLRSFADIEVRCGERTIGGEVFFAPESKEAYFGFAAHPAWQGHVEV